MPEVKTSYSAVRKVLRNGKWITVEAWTDRSAHEEQMRQETQKRLERSRGTRAFFSSWEIADTGETIRFRKPIGKFTRAEFRTKVWRNKKWLKTNLSRLSPEYRKHVGIKYNVPQTRIPAVVKKAQIPKATIKPRKTIPKVDWRKLLKGI